MIAWIMAKDVPAYMAATREEGADPSVLEQQEDRSLVSMTASVAQLWTVGGYWYQIQ